MTLPRIPDSFMDQIYRTMGYYRYSLHNKVAEALSRIPRELFLEEKRRNLAYNSRPVRIPMKQTCSAPDIYAIFMAKQAGDIKPGLDVLEIGTGSGYGAALLAHVIYPGKLVSIERHPELVEFSRNNVNTLCRLAETDTTLNFKGNNLSIFHGDGSKGINDIYDQSPVKEFDRVMVTAGAPVLPEDMVSILKPGGIIIIPVESRFDQELLKYTKDASGNLTKAKLMDVRFVPLIGENAH